MFSFGMWIDNYLEIPKIYWGTPKKVQKFMKKLKTESNQLQYHCGWMKIPEISEKFPQ